MSEVTPEFNEEWRYEGWTSENEVAHAGSLDSDGSFILAGVKGVDVTPRTDDTFTETISADFAAVKLEGASGVVVWDWTDQSTGSSGEQLESIFGADTNSNNDVVLGGYVTGNWDATNENGVRHLAAVKLEGSTGDEVWRFQDVAQDSMSTIFYTTYYGSGTIIGVAVDDDDNVFLVGGTYNSLVDGEGYPGDFDYFIIKIAGETGTKIFTVQGGLSFHWDVLYDAKVDFAGNVVVAGMSGSEEQADSLVVKLSGTDGSVIWEYSPFSFTIDVLHAVDVDDQGDVYVAGGEDAENKMGDITESPVVMKLSGANGTLEWMYSGATTSRTIFRSVAVDPTTGWIVGAGHTEGTWLAGEAQGGNDFAAVVLDGDRGEELARYQNGTDGSDVIKFAGFDSAGALFFGGYTSGLSEDLDIVGVKFFHLGEKTPTPAPSYSPTPVVTSAPVVLTPPPATLTNAPSHLTVTAVTPTPIPVSPTVTSVPSTSTPASPTHRPIFPTATPVFPTPTPVFPTPAPVSSTNALVSPTANPISSMTIPVFPTPVPVSPTVDPVSPTADPVSSTTLPPVPQLPPPHLQRLFPH